MAYPKYTLTGKTPAQTYENLVQFNYESSSLVNGDGNDITASLVLTVVSASTSVSASWAPTTTQASASWTSHSFTSTSASFATSASALLSSSGLTTTLYLTASVTTMSFINGLLQSVT